MAGRYPNTDDARRNRNERAFDWTTLPLEGRQGPAPELPSLRPWTEDTLWWWTQLWSTPQAVMWDSTGRTLHTLAILHHQLMIDGALAPAASKAASIAAEMRQHEDRHGLTPKAMLQLRWRISSTPADGSGKVLQLVPKEVADRMVEHRPDPSLMPAKRASKAAWVEWAEAHGMERSTAELLSKSKLIEEYSSTAPAPPAQEAPAQPVSRAAERIRQAAAKKPAAKKRAAARKRKR